MPQIPAIPAATLPTAAANLAVITQAGITKSVALSALLPGQAAYTLFGNNTAGAATPGALTQAQVAALMANWQAQQFYGYYANLTLSASPTITAATLSGLVIGTTNAGAYSLALPIDLLTGWTATIIQYGAGQVTFTVSGASTLRNRQAHTKMAGQYSIVSLIVLANAGGSAAEYLLAGDTAP
jgi:hypothetical protein